MWYIISISNPDDKYVLLSGKEYIVGRKDCPIVIASDQAVSRKHAALTVSHGEAALSHPHRLPILKLKDLSKFGTFVNKERLKGETLIKDGDEIVFGSSKSTFTVVCEPYIISTSCLDTEAKQSVRSSICILGGHSVNEWRKDCSLLVMNSVSVTIKVICALVSQKPIVTPDYLVHFVEHLKGKEEAPDPDRFLPPIAETQINEEEVSFRNEPRRQNLFSGMKFIFLNPKQFKKMNLAVELAGGTPVLMEEGCDDTDDRVLIEPGTVVMTCDPEEEGHTLTQHGREWAAHVQKYLRKHKKHMIQDAELGYAVLFCSTEKHCNPDSNPSEYQQIPCQSLSQSTEFTQKRSPSKQTSNKDKASTPGPSVSAEDTTQVKSEQSPVIPVTKVKQEQRSQELMTGEATPSQGRRGKRARDENIEDDDTAVRPSIFKKMKEEKITPRKQDPDKGSRGTGSRVSKLDVNIDDGMESTSGGETFASDDNSRTRKHKTEARYSETSPKRIRESDKVKDEAVVTRGRKSPSPVPTTRGGGDRSPVKEDRRRNNKRTREGSPDDIMETADSRVQKSEDFERSPASRVNVFDREVSPGKSSNHSPVSRSRRGGAERPVSPVKNEDGYLSPVDGGRGKTERSPSPARGTRRGASPSGNPVKSDKSPVYTSQTRGNRKGRSPSPSRSKVTGDRSPVRKGAVEDREPSPVSNRGHQRPGAVVKEELNEDKRTRRKGVEDIKDVAEDSPMDRVPVYENRTLPSGFLTTRKPIEDQVDKSSEYELEEDLPSKCIMTEFMSLMVRQPKRVQTNTDTRDVPDGCVKWKGQIVKNFKKFKKADRAGANSLPQIIGGSDLEVHINGPRKDLDDWFEEAREMESQQNESDRRAKELFEFEPSKARRR